MALPASDAFTNTNGTHLATHNSNWYNNVGQMDIQNNELCPDQPNNECGFAWTGDTFDNDHYSEATWVRVSGVTYACGVGVRHSNSGEYYYLFYSDATTTYFYVNDNSSVSQLSSDGSNPDPGDTMRLEAEGTTITPSITGSGGPAPSAATDSTLSTGYAGVTGYHNDASASIDDWEGGNLSGAPAALEVSVSDTITVAESSTVLITELFASVSDTVTVAESTTVSRGEATTLEVDVSDTVTVAEAVSLDLPLEVDVSDTVTVNEAASAQPDELHVSVSDTITVNEDATVAVEGVIADLEVSVSDIVTVNEGVTAELDELHLSVSDDITVAEAVTLDLPLEVDVSDTVTVAESVEQYLDELFISVSDTVTVNESVTVSKTGGALSINVSETITVAESVTTHIDQLYIGVSDTLTVAEAITMFLGGETPASRTIPILSESRVLALQSEDRAIAIANEDRTKVI